jgi:hypothetical protein
VFWDVAIISLMIEAVRASGTSVSFYQTTRRYITEDGHLHVFFLKISVSWIHIKFGTENAHLKVIWLIKF